MIIVGIILSLLLWILLFSSDILGNFWLRLTLSVSILFLYAALTHGGKIRSRLRLRLPDLLIGAASGILLYIIFLAGYNLLGPWVSAGSSKVYQLAYNTPQALIALTLIYTSVGEEVFWRGYIQDVLQTRIGGMSGYLATTLLYSAIHLPTMNLPLVLAAFLAGCLWGALYLWRGVLISPITSHIIWTELVFVLAPLK